MYHLPAVLKLCADNSIPATLFELTFILACLHYEKERCEVVVLEVCFRDTKFSWAPLSNLRHALLIHLFMNLKQAYDLIASAIGCALTHIKLTHSFTVTSLDYCTLYSSRL